jgi:transglutaminase superfamily protein
VILSFAELAGSSDARLDELALAIAAELRPVDPVAALAALDALGRELADGLAGGDGSPAAEARAVAELLGGRHGFEGDRDEYDDPANSMLDLVLERRRGLPILLSTVYAEVARRAGVAIHGVGMPGHYVVAHFGARPPLLLDPFARGVLIEGDVADPGLVRPWTPHETALRMLNNLVGSYRRRGDVGAAIKVAGMRLALPADPVLRDSLRAELVAMQASLN